MALSSEALKTLMKQKIDAIDISSGEVGNDALLTAIAESMVVAFSDNLIESSPLRGGEVGASQVYIPGTVDVLAWDGEPTGTYSATNTEGFSQMSISVSVTGGWTVTGFSTAGSDSGRWKPTASEDTTSYEIRFTTSGDSVNSFGPASPIGSWNNLDNTASISLVDAAAGTKSTSVTLEIREKADPLNTTGVATFTLTADGVAPK